jgi:hypothetical protein
VVKVGIVQNVRVNEPSNTPQSVVVTWRVLAWVCVAVAAAGIIAFAATANAGRIAFALFAAFFAVGAWSNFAKRYEVHAGRLVIRRALSRRTLELGRLVAAEAVEVRASRGRVFWQLVLQDMAGTRVRMSLLHADSDARAEFLFALAPFVKGPGVTRTGPIDRALRGEIW